MGRGRGTNRRDRRSETEEDQEVIYERDAVRPDVAGHNAGGAVAPAGAGPAGAEGLHLPSRRRAGGGPSFVWRARPPGAVGRRPAAGAGGAGGEGPPPVSAGVAVRGGLLRLPVRGGQR